MRNGGWISNLRYKRRNAHAHAPDPALSSPRDGSQSPPRDATTGTPPARGAESRSATPGSRPGGPDAGERRDAPADEDAGRDGERESRARPDTRRNI